MTIQKGSLQDRVTWLNLTMSIIKIGGSTKWKEHDEISKVANFETTVA